MAEINLLQTEKKSKRINVSEQVSGKGVFIVLIGLMVLELIAYGLLFSFSKKVVNERDQKKQEIAEFEKKINQPSADLKSAVKAQGTLENIQTLLAQHVHWTRVWKELGDHTLKEAQYVSIAGTSDNYRFVVQGRAPSYSELGKLILGLQSSNNFKEVHLVSSGESRDTKAGGVDFAIAVIFDPGLFVFGDTSETLR